VVILHALASDVYGNVIFPSYRNLPQSLDITLSRACDRVIVSVERIVSESFLKRHARLVELPSWRVEAVAVAPLGAHPTSMLGRYQDDNRHWQDYVDASQSQEAFEAYLAAYVHGVDDHQGYLDKVGGSQVAALYQVDTQQ
jgi:glutaconate CoA-transferase subunit A